MANTRKKNDFYSSTIQEFFEGKDSTMEMAKILEYDKERLVARVFTLSSRQYRDDVPVFFPAMFSNTGIISPPVKNSNSLLYWGPDRQPFLLPIQLTVPNVSVANGVTSVNASPGMYDELLSLKNIQGGEHLLRSLGGAYIFLKNIGEVEIGTSRLHRLTLSEQDGALDMVHERIRGEIGNSRFYFGPASIDSNVDTRTHLYFELDETSDETQQIESLSDDELLQRVLNNEIDEVDLVSSPKLFTSQMGHVILPDGSAKVDEEDHSELFEEKVLAKEDASRVETLSKDGRKTITTVKGDRATKVVLSGLDAKIEQTRMVDGEVKTTGIGINESGSIVCSEDGKEYDLMAVLKWFHEERTV